MTSQSLNLMKPPTLSVEGFSKNLSTTAIGHSSVRLTSHPSYRCPSILLTNILHISLAHSNLINSTQLGNCNVVATLAKKLPHPFP